MNIYIVGSFPEIKNSNANLRHFVANGFKEAIDDGVVYDFSYDFFLNCCLVRSGDFVLFLGSILEIEHSIESLALSVRKVGAISAIWLHDDPYEFDANERIFHLVDFIFTNDAASMRHYPEDLAVFHLPMACDRSSLDYKINQRPGPDYFFAGFPYSNRKNFFKEFKSLLDDKSYSYKGLVAGPGWDLSQFPFAIDKRINTNSLYKFYSESLSTIYLGREYNLFNSRFGIRPSTPGPRLFEAAGIGSCQLCSTPGLEILEYFDDGIEIILVDGPEEALDMIARLKKDPQASINIGINAKFRVMHNHLYFHRAKKILKIVEQH